MRIQTSLFVIVHIFLRCGYVGYLDSGQDLPITPINWPIIGIGRFIGSAKHRNHNIGSVSDRPILRPYIG